MDDPPPYSDSNSARGSTTGTPRWVMVFGIVVIVLILLFGILHLTGGGLGGPHGIR